MSLSPGSNLGRYQIRSRLGAGGMGEVYLAEDTMLRRSVAIKILTGDYTKNEQRLRRFEREAYAASSLNHPNIVTIYEIGSEGGLHFIVNEYVDGESLRQHMLTHQMELLEVLDVAIQIASALATAHQNGIIHRDIKPENVMLRSDGYLKVLDFGLAKLAIEPEPSDTDTEASTQLLLVTEPGQVMGTINYMSPEQVRGQEVDERTDVFSLGVIIYEMLTRHRPFKGDTKSDVLAAVLMIEPRPLAETLPEMPTELNRIVSKTLKKDREERYQTAKELLIDLKSLRHEVEFEIKAGRSFPVVPAGADHAPTTTPLSSRSTTARQADTTYTISELFINEVKTHPKRSTATLLVLAFLIIAGAFGIYKLVQLAKQPEPFQNMRLVKATFAGNAVDGQVSISPDGRYVAYVVDESGQQSLWVRQVATSTDLSLIAPQGVKYHGLTFSPDGNYVYYSVVETKDLPILYKVGSLGGTPRKLIEDADGPVTISPDGSQVAFLRENRKLMIASSDGEGIKTLATAQTGKAYGFPAWSPNGEIIVCVLYSSADKSRGLVEISVKDGKEKPFGRFDWNSLPGIAWIADGSGLLLTARDPETKLLQIWLIRYPSGELRRITNDLSRYVGVSATKDGKTIASVQAENLSNIWTINPEDSKSAKRLTFEPGRYDGYIGVAITSDGRVVYNSRESGRWDLWLVNQNGSDNRQLTFNANNVTPSVTPDGRYVVYISNRSGRDELWRSDLSGSNAKQLTDSLETESFPHCTPDGKWVVYHLATEYKSTVWKISIDGGTPQQLTIEDSGRPVVSPDGKFVACEYGEAGPDTTVKLAIIPIEGGSPIKILDLPLVVKSRGYRWSADGRGFIYIDSVSRVYNLWSQSIDSSPPKQLTDFSSDQIFRFDLTPNGKRVALSRGQEGSDIVLITDFR